MALENTQNRTIVLPISQADYSAFINCAKTAHQMIRQLYGQHPDLFPAAMKNGYCLNGRSRRSKKLGFQQRKIKVDGVSYRIRPSFVLPYCRSTSDQVAHGLFLLGFGVPFWAIALVFGRYPMWWYRLYLCFSSYNLVGTTVKVAARLPTNLLADEHHIRQRGQKAYVATVCGAGCFLGLQTSPHADEASLKQSYGVFRQEAQQVQSDYQPDTVNTDGWKATQNAWKALYPKITVIECFLHAFLKVRDRAVKRLQPYFEKAADKIWDCYRAADKRSLAQQLRRLREWTCHQVPDSPMRQAIFKLCEKRKQWSEHLDFPQAHRTSNMMDRLMRSMARHAFHSQMFHGSTASTTRNFRAFGLLYNFTPSCPAAWDDTGKLQSPASRLNGFTYHDNWLENLLIATSMGGNHDHRNLL